ADSPAGPPRSAVALKRARTGWTPHGCPRLSGPDAATIAHDDRAIVAVRATRGRSQSERWREYGKDRITPGQRLKGHPPGDGRISVGPGEPAEWLSMKEGRDDMISMRQKIGV